MRECWSHNADLGFELAGRRRFWFSCQPNDQVFYLRLSRLLQGPAFDRHHGSALATVAAVRRGFAELSKAINESCNWTGWSNFDMALSGALLFGLWCKRDLIFLLFSPERLLLLPFSCAAKLVCSAASPWCMAMWSLTPLRNHGKTGSKELILRCVESTNESTKHHQLCDAHHFPESVTIHPSNIDRISALFWSTQSSSSFNLLLKLFKLWSAFIQLNQHAFRGDLSYGGFSSSSPVASQKRQTKVQKSSDCIMSEKRIWERGVKGEEWKMCALH